MPPTKQRRPRQNPLIPTAPEPTEVVPAPLLLDSPICGACWPDGWASLGDGDFASCEHGEWAKTEHLAKVAAGDMTINGARRAQGLAPIEFPDAPVLFGTIDGVTTDGTPVKVTIRPGEPALISLSDVDLGSVAISPPVVDLITPVSPFRPQPAPAPVEIDPGELDTGADVMFMPSGG